MKESELIFFLGCCVLKVYGQIGVTTCEFATAANCPNFLPNSYCDLGTLYCVCPSGYLASATNIACEYDCGSLTNPANGAVATNDGTRTGDNAVYTCVSTYKVVGTATRTCVQDTGWDNAEPTCDPAVLGDDCSTNALQCDNIANGQCLSTCQCNAGYEDDGTGLACSDIDECVGNACQNGATCVDGINDYTCTCVAGYDGNMCQNNINECLTHACQNGATCVDGINTYTCVCVAGYDGDFCSNNIDECATNPCTNGGTCVDGINDFTCNCVAGYTDKTCSTNIDDCATSPCQNGGTCQDLINDYNCVCVAGYTDKNCQTDIDECESHACNNGATCVDLINTYECVCDAGWTGTYCTSNIDECEGNQCQNGAICVDGINEYTCDCVDGYNGNFCQNNINECVGHACLNGATCVDGINQYTCTCVAGYTGEFCATDIDECDGHACLNGATCVDGINKYTCTCVAGYTDQFCQTNIDECTPDKCLNGATCVDNVNDYTCNCVTGYTDKNCQTNIDECDPDPCQNGATCVDGVNDYTCNCVAGYDGKNCQTNIDECSSDPCENGGTCVDEINRYTCNCVPGYNGNECENNIDECIGNICENGATCVDGINEYTCDCVPGYDGTFCGNDIDECASHSCQNSATCIDEINAYSCVCAAGYTDFYCQTDIDECASSPCQNDGTCTDQVNGYVCTCSNGFTGLTCRPGELGDDCSARAVVCDNLTNAECDGSTCVCESGFEDPTEATGSCSRVDCGTVTPPVNGAVDHTTENTLFESKAYFSCDAGYTLTGLSSVTCQADETWDGATPSCVSKDCGTVATPLNGQLHYTPNTEYQGLAEFSCNTGFTLIGNATRTCQDNGVWSSANPFCQINDCEAIVAPTNGNVDLTDGTTYQSVAVFQCNNGYDLVGEASLECLADGSWGHAKPTCNIKDCGNLKSPTHGSVELTDGTLFEATAVFSCDAGYTLTGDSERYCTNTGVWDNSSPTCVVKANDVNICPKNTDNRGQIWIETFSGEVRKVRCKPSFSGQITRSCNSDGKWQLPVYNCVRENVQKLDSFVKSMTMNSSSEDITAALTSILTTTTADQNIASNEKLTNGEVKILITSLKNVANILPPSLVTNESIVSTFLGSVDNLLDTTNNDTWLSETDSASAGQLLSATDTLSEAISTHLKTDGAIITTIKSNIGLQASRVSRSGIHFPESEPDQNWLGKARSTIQMEWQSFPDLSKPYAATTVIYRNLNGILPNTYSEAKYNSKSTMKEEEKTIINGPVLALTLPGQKSRQLDKAISITFEHLDVGLSTPVCVHWQFRNDSNGFWSTDGCRLVLTNDDVTTCECDHLTNFAVLMSAFKKVDTSLYLSIISITGISISLLCLVLTFIVHFIFWKYLRSERTTLLMNLCISLAVAYIIFLAGIHRTESKAFCTVVAAFLHYIFLVVFCLMLVEGIQITIMVSFVFKTTKSRTRIFLIFAWVVPAVIVGISLYVTKLKGYGNNHVCWLSSDNGLIWAFVGPAVFTIFMNIICLGLVLRAVCSIGAMKIKSVSEKVKASVRSICVLLPLFGISWILGLLNIDDSFIFVQYIFAILNGLQGFFIFLSHCIFNKQIKKAFGQWQRKRRSKKFTQMKTNQLRPSTTSRDYRTTEPTRSGTSTIYRNTEPIVNLIDTHTDKTIEVQDEMNSELSGRFYLTKM